MPGNVLMPTRRFSSLLFFAACVVMAAPLSVRAQQMGEPPSKLPASLGEALRVLPMHDDVRGKSVLLYVGINPDAEPARLRERTDTPPEQITELPAPSAKGEYRLQAMAALYHRRMISVGSVTAFAPTLTTELATRLPLPDLNADLSRAEKLRRLEATLSPAQWRLMGSASGLGEGDLKPSQKAVFASLLPNPLYIQRTVNKSDGAYPDYQPAVPTLLSKEQRSGFRLTLARRLSWFYAAVEPAKADGSYTMVGLSVNSPTGSAGTETFALRDEPSPMWNAPETVLFGAVVKSVVPFHPKPSDLDYGNVLLDAPVSAANAQTVGDLVERVRQKTGLDVVCDLRYRSLNVVVWGGETQAVRAGDVLHALALGVSGTFRRVADDKSAAYVLTDDGEGLGARQARIFEWAQAAAAQRQKEAAAVQKALAKTNIGNYLGWFDGDANAPTGDLVRRIEEYRTGKIAPSDIDNQNTQPNRGLWAAISELPPLAQNAIKLQIESDNQGREERRKQNLTQTNPAFAGRETPPLRSDRVKLEVRVGIAFLIPGIGRVDATGGGFGSGQDLLPAPPDWRPPFVRQKPDLAPVAVIAKPSPRFRLTQSGGPVRALSLALPENVQGVGEIVSAAKAHGFNQLWVKMPLGEKTPAMLAEMIAVGNVSGIGVQAVVSVLRRPTGNRPDFARTLNQMGETMTEWASRHAAPPILGDEPAEPVSGDDYAEIMQQFMERNAWRQKEQGDFLDALYPSVEAAVFHDLQTLARTPGLAGVVVRDVAAPGMYHDAQAGDDRTDTGSVVEDFGYTPAARLHFLRQAGVDPVDLSPLPYGEIPAASSPDGTNHPSVRLTLPQIIDYGSEEATGPNAGEAAQKTSGTAVWALWNTFRQKEAEAFWNRLQKNYAAAATPAQVPLLRQKEDRNSAYNITDLEWTGSWDKSAPSAPVPAVPPAGSDEEAALFLKQARQTSSRVLLTLHYDVGERLTQRKPPSFVSELTEFLAPIQTGWDGFVLDFSNAPNDAVLPLLSDLPVDPAQFFPVAPPTKSKP